MILSMRGMAQGSIALPVEVSGSFANIEIKIETGAGWMNHS